MKIFFSIAFVLIVVSFFVFAGVTLSRYKDLDTRAANHRKERCMHFLLSTHDTGSLEEDLHYYKLDKKQAEIYCLNN